VKSHHVSVESRLASGLFLPLHVTPLLSEDELDLAVTEGYEKKRIERTESASLSLLGPILTHAMQRQPETRQPVSNPP
jgi:hypothetical protein